MDGVLAPVTAQLMRILLVGDYAVLPALRGSDTPSISFIPLSAYQMRSIRSGRSASVVSTRRNGAFSG